MIARPVIGHVKWFVDDAAALPTDWAFATAGPSLLMLAVAVLLALAWRGAARHLPVPELRLLAFVARLGPWVPRLLGVHLGVSLLALAVTNAYLSPDLSLDAVSGGSAVALAEGVVGVWLITGVRLRAAAVSVVALGPLALVLAGPVAVVEAADLLGVALFLTLLPPGPDRFGAASVEPADVVPALLAMRVGVGVSLIVVAFSEKLAAPAVAAEFLQHHPAFQLFSLTGIDVADSVFIRFTAAVEVLFGLLLISGAAPQAAVIVAGIPFNATLFFLGRSELIGHLPIYGAMLALLVYGSDDRLAPSIPKLAGGLRGVAAAVRRTAGRVRAVPP